MGCLHLGYAGLVNECFDKLFVKFYFPISLFVMVSSLFTAVLIVHISLKGTLINAYPRRHMSKLLITKVMNECKIFSTRCILKIHDNIVPKIHLKCTIYRYF